MNKVYLYRVATTVGGHLWWRWWCVSNKVLGLVGVHYFCFDSSSWSCAVEMAPKKKASGKVKAGEEAILDGDEANRLRIELNAGHQLDDTSLLKLLRSDTPCHGLYSKSCKVWI